MSQQPTRERSDCVNYSVFKGIEQSLFSDFKILSKVYMCCDNTELLSHGSCTQYQKQLQELEEKNAAAQEMQRKLEAELNEVG